MAAGSDTEGEQFHFDAIPEDGDFDPLSNAATQNPTPSPSTQVQPAAAPAKKKVIAFDTNHFFKLEMIADKNGVEIGKRVCGVCK